MVVILRIWPHFNWIFVTKSKIDQISIIKTEFDLHNFEEADGEFVRGGRGAFCVVFHKGHIEVPSLQQMAIDCYTYAYVATYSILRYKQLLMQP